MKQGLEVLWWKHNMIPTKGSIQQPPLQTSTYPRLATHLWHTLTHIQPPPHTLFTSIWLKPEWTSGAADLLMRHRKQLQKCLQAASLQSSAEAPFRGICQRKRNPWRSLKSCRAPKSCHAWWIPTLGTHFHSDSSGHTSRTPTFRGLFCLYKCRQGTQVLSPRLIWASAPLFNSTPPFFLK